MVVEGEQVVIGDTGSGDSRTVGYEGLCRRHHLARMPARTAHAATLSSDPLPFGDPASPA